MAAGLEGYVAGTNLGHWISQYGKQGKKHWDTYIIASDFDNIARLGFDHVRLPVDYFIFDHDDGKFDEDTLKYVDFTLEQCKRTGLNLVLDLHHAPGFFFGNSADANTLMTDPDVQEHFINIWRFFASRYNSEGDNLIFELLNELVWKDSVPWDALWQRAVAAINEITPARRIIVGGNYWNSPGQLKYLTVSPSDRVIYNIHIYEPMIFTHQRAGWMEQMRNYTVPVEYPVDVRKHAAFWNNNIPQYIAKYDFLDRRFIEEGIAPAVEFIEKNNRTVYCGEYGVIANADIPSSMRWYNDMADILLPLNIGRAVWSWRGFANVTGSEREIVSQDLIKAVTRKA